LKFSQTKPSSRTQQELQKNLISEQGKLIDGLAKKSYLHNCAEVKSNGIYEILHPNFISSPFKVACDANNRGGGWTIILRRMDGSVNFYRNWNAYKKGFGDLDGEFFLGLDKIHALTAEYSQELLVVLEDFQGAEKFETYEKFAIGNEDELYALHTLGKANGTAGDSLRTHYTTKFSTFDRVNNINGTEKCNGGWWYKSYINRYNENLIVLENSCHKTLIFQ